MLITRKDLPNYLEFYKGKELASSNWHEITQAMIDRFAAATDDNQPIHIDKRIAEQSIFGSTIAHGFLTLSMLSSLAKEALPQIEGTIFNINYGLDKVRFLQPVKCNSLIRATFTLADYKIRLSQKLLLTYNVQMEAKGAKLPVLQAQWLILTQLA